LEAGEIMKEYAQNTNNERIRELKQAVSSGKFFSDINDIWRGINEGRIKTLFIEQNLFHPAVIENDNITIVSETERNNKAVIDDIYDEMIEMNLHYGGDVVFLPPGELKEFNGFGATTRF